LRVEWRFSGIGIAWSATLRSGIEKLT
jgi:hypothetical protein